jgi:hypothetical protein
MLQKQPLNISFNQGVQTKVDPYQLPIGQFQSLTNTVFNKDGLQTKRNGFGLLTDAPAGAQTLATLNSGLVALGDTCQSYNQDSGQLTNAGLFQPMKLATTTLVRRATSQTTCDVAIASNGLACSTWMDADGNSYYQISDSLTGQVVIPSTMIPSTGTMPRVYAVSTYFIVTFLATVSAATHLQYICIPISNPNNPNAPVDIFTSASSLSAAYDGVSYNNSLYIALNCSGGGGVIKVWSITAPQLFIGNTPTPATITGDIALLLSLTIDSSNTGYPIIWVSYSNAANLTAFALNSDLTIALAPTSIPTGYSDTIANLVSTATNNVLTVILDLQTTYSYPVTAPEISDTRTDYLSFSTLTLSGTAAVGSLISIGVGLNSRALISSSLNKTVFIACYGQQYQPTNFLMDISGNVLARFAYSNGSGYPINQILPNINESNNVLQIGYLFADLIQPVNKTQGDSLPGVYAQLGVNLITFSLDGQTAALEIGNSLNVSGGMLWQYDGVKIREHGFNVWPEDIGIVGSPVPGNMTPDKTPVFYIGTYEWTDAAGNIHRSAPSVPVEFTILTPVSFTANRTSGSPVLTSVSSFTGLQIGQPIIGAGIATNAYILSINSGASTVTMSAAATSGSNTSTTITPSALSSLTVNVPYCRQTYKDQSNFARIVLYRWSEAQQLYYRCTPLNDTQLLNNTTLFSPTVQSVAFVDSSSDAEIVGNDIIYTNGGVIENICAPGAVAMTLWQSRLFLADAEDQNLIWFSKQVIENTPVEMSDLLTLYIAPTTGSQGSTGPITALSSMDDKLIIFKKNAIYYITGSGPDNTGANNSFSDPVFITSTTGTDNPQSIVLTPNGIMFQSDKGIWILGRDLSTTYIGSSVESYTQGNIVTSALCIPATNQVRITLNNRTAVMYDYFFNRWSNWSNIAAKSSVVYEDSQAFLNIYGQIVQETPGKYLDISTPVLLGTTTGWINLAGVQGLERFYFGNLLGTYYTPFNLSIQLAYNYNPSIQQTILVSPDNYVANWGGEAVWGSGEPWGGPGNVFSARFFPDVQKCQSFQVTIQELYDPSFGVAAGAGLTLSGMNLIVGTKRGYRTQSAAKSFGGTGG